MNSLIKSLIIQICIFLQASEYQTSAPAVLLQVAWSWWKSLQDKVQPTEFYINEIQLCSTV